MRSVQFGAHNDQSVVVVSAWRATERNDAWKNDEKKQGIWWIEKILDYLWRWAMLTGNVVAESECENEKKVVEMRKSMLVAHEAH